MNKSDRDLLYYYEAQYAGGISGNVFWGVILASVLAAIIVMAATAHAGDLPNPALTPGVINPHVTQENIKSTICVSGWTKTIRPPASYTNKLKIKQMAEYGFPPGTDPHSVEEDHLISLELGGHPTDPRNLWPEPWDGEWGAHKKDVIETKLKRLVCSGAISLDVAQAAIRTNWIAAYRLYVQGR